jgi:hypothetical protein
MEHVIDKKQRQKLYDINLAITEVLRDEILKDTGVSRLKSKVLDLITTLRVQAKVIKDQKM